MRNLRYLTIIFVFSLTACESAQERDARIQDQAKAPYELSKHDAEICGNDFKLTMNNPASFSLAGVGVKDTEANKYIWNPNNRHVAYIVPIRGSNAFGAIMMSQMRCVFRFDEKTKKLEFVYSR